MHFPVYFITTKNSNYRDGRQRTGLDLDQFSHRVIIKRHFSIKFIRMETGAPDLEIK